VRAAAVRGGEAIRARDWTEHERQQRRWRNAEQGLARNLTLGYHGPRWTAGQIALLGTMPDEKVARRIGRTPNAVRQQRARLGIAKPFDGRHRADRT
jgi:hypothetical protein